MRSKRSQEVVIEEDLYLERIGYVTAILLPDRLTWHLAESDNEAVGNCCWGQTDTEITVRQVPISELYASEMCEMISNTSACLCGSHSAPIPQMYRFAVHTFQRSQYKQCDWVPKVYTFCHEHADICQEWVARIQGLLNSDGHRPKSLLVLVNPYGGNRTGIQKWELVAPLFERARVRTKVILTERAGHAHDLMTKASEEDLKTQDGVVVVGGDGLFNEVLNGLLIKRHKGCAAPKPQWVSKMLAKAFNEGKKMENNGSNVREGFEPRDAMDKKHDPHESFFDVHAPLLKRSRYPAVDISRSKSSSSASSSSNALCNMPFESNLQEAINTGATDLATGKERELSEVDSVNFSCAGTSPETGLPEMEGPDLYPDTTHRGPESTDGGCLSSPAAVVRRNRLGIRDVQRRIGIIPAGSTDTVAISTTGSRDPVTAALHILLGDRMPLDVVRITGWKKTPQSGDEPPTVRYAASFAGYGFYGDVMKESETTRWMGPARYDIAGAKAFMKHKKYMAEVSFLEIPANVTRPEENGDLVRKAICRENCFVCSQGIDLNHLLSDLNDDVKDPRLQPPKYRWKTRRDSFHSIGAAVMSCRNDKAPDGISAHAHLADGLLHLILIKSCSRPNFLRFFLQESLKIFSHKKQSPNMEDVRSSLYSCAMYIRQLITLTQRGADPLDFDFVEHYKTPVFTFTSHGEQSIWNVDGELFPAHELSAQCFRGLVSVFARGPEL